MTKVLYATAEETAALLREGKKYRHERLRAADMISVTEAASLLKRGWFDDRHVDQWRPVHRAGRPRRNAEDSPLAVRAVCLVSNSTYRQNSRHAGAVADPRLP